MSTTQSIATETIECACTHCADYATRKGLTMPLKAEVNVQMLAATGRGSAARHNLVKIAYQPPFGQVQAKGPWAVLNA